ncbi:unnamed protein product [Owenia fusiformis]|uniref:Metalloendopeptidase n=1 Tax=Owenia fusiformis TaxID=6347 RepID=A0A8J1Y1D9_OWEFU|nr:unnamed protein product [Owenia fusiformis]
MAKAMITFVICILMIFQDIMAKPMEEDDAPVRQESIWPNGVVPYTIVSKYEQSEVDIIKDAMDKITKRTSLNGEECIVFKQRDSEENFIQIYHTEGSFVVLGNEEPNAEPNNKCYSRVGMTGKGQPVALGKKCITQGTVMHILLHTLGLWHEESRADRDKYIDIDWSNIQDSHAGNFEALNIEQFDMPYDYDSIMHSTSTSFAKDKKNPTLIPRGDATIGQRIYLSANDINKIRKLYGCKGEKKVVIARPFSV